MTSRRAGLWFTLLFIGVAAAARAPALAQVGLWRDEAATYLYATARTPGDFIALIRHVEANPPGYFYLLYLWVHAFGSAPAVLKLPAYIFSLVLIWLTYELGCRLASPRVGVCAAVLICAAPMSTFLALESRAYTLAACCCTLIVLLYDRACANPSPRALSTLALAAAAAPFVHYTGILFLVAIAIVTAARSKLPTSTRLRVVLALAAAALPFAVWIPSFIAQARAGLSIQEHTNPADAFGLLVGQIVSLFPGPPAIAIGLIALLAMCTFARVRAGLPPAVPAYALAVGLLTAAMIAGLNLSARWYFYPFAPIVIVCATAYATAAASRLSSPSRKIRSFAARYMVPAATMLVVFVELPADSRLLHTAFSGVPALVNSAATPADTYYVLVPDYIAPTFAYYDQSLRARSLSFDAFGREDHPEIFRFSDDYAKVWNCADLVARSERRYLRAARRSRFLALVIEGYIPQTSTLPMHSASVALLADVRRHLKAVDRRDYSGTVEPLVVYRFRLPAEPAATLTRTRPVPARARSR